MAARLRLFTIGLSALAYLTSMFLPMGADREFGTIPGFASFFAAFAFWRESASPALFFAVWLANPVYWLGIYCLDYDKPIRATIAGFLSLSLAILDIQRMAALVADYPAYWVWLGSFTIFALGSTLCVAAGPFKDSTRVSDQRLGLTDSPVLDERIQRLQ